MKNTDYNALEAATPILVTAMAEASNLRTVFSPGQQPCIDLANDIMYLPSIPVKPSKADTNKTLGFVIHECGHKLFTSIKQIADDFTAHLENIFEDARIETLQMRSWSGGQDILIKLVETLVKEKFFEPPSDKHEKSLLSAYLLYTLRAKYLGQKALTPFADQASQMFLKVFGKRLKQRIDSLFPMVFNHLDNENIALELAQYVITFLKEEAEDKTPPPPSNPQSGDSDDSDDSSSQSSNNQSPDNSNDDSGDSSTQSSGDSDDSSGDSKSSSSNDLDDSDDTTSQSSKSSCQDSDTSGTNQSQTAQAAQNALDQSVDDIDECLGDLGEAMGGSLPDQPGSYNPMCYNESKVISSSDTALVQEAMALASRSLSQIKNLLMARTRRTRRKQNRGYRLDDRGFHRLASNQTNIFQKKLPNKGVNTAVTILIDASGSMKKSMAMTNKLALACALTLEQIPQISVSIATFEGDEDVKVLKKFSEKTQNVASAFRKGTSGTTPMSQGLFWAMENIVEARKQRNIVITFTDGVPDYLPSALEMIELLNGANIETWGIGLKVHQQKFDQLFKNNVVIDDISQFSFSLLSLLEEGYQLSYF